MVVFNQSGRWIWAGGMSPQIGADERRSGNSPELPFHFRSVSSALISGRVFSNHAAAVRRRPHNTSTDEPTIASPTDIKSAVTNASCHGRAWWPAPVMGESAPTPQAAASVVATQFTYVP